MFLGVIDRQTREWIAGNAHLFKDRKIAVGCSGNFTSDRLFKTVCGAAEVHSNDVSLYSTLIGNALLRRPFHLGITEEAGQKYGWVEKYFDDSDPFATLSAVVVLAKYLRVDVRHNQYQSRMADYYLRAFEELIEKTRKGFEDRRFEINSFACMDVQAFFEGIEDQDTILCSYMPFFKGDYESQSKRLDAITEWERPEYDLIDKARRAAVAELCKDRPHLVLLDFELEDRDPVMVNHHSRNTWVYVYSNLDPKRGHFRRKRHFHNIRFPLIAEDHRFAREQVCTVHPVQPLSILHYKDLWLAKNIDYARASQFAFACALDGRLIGFLEYQVKIAKKKRLTNSSFYLLSDFPVDLKPHPRLSKLITMLSLCDEVRYALRKWILHRLDFVLTTARTDRPVSMKYRGVFKKDSIGFDATTGERFINYKQRFSGRASQEVYQAWLKRFNVIEKQK